jgi:hypothetical protein
MGRNIFAEMAEVSKKLPPPSAIKAMADAAQALRQAGVFLESPLNHERPAVGMPPARPETPDQETAPPKPATDTQTPMQGAAAAPQTNPVKATLKWLKSKKRQFIVRHNEPEMPIFENGAITHIKPSISEWRIKRTAAFIYRALCEAAENREIPLEIDAIADFMINNLKQKDGSDITKDSLTKADKRRQSSPK